MSYLITYLANAVILYFILSVSRGEIGEFSLWAILLFWVPAILGFSYWLQRILIFFSRSFGTMLRQPPRQVLDVFLSSTSFPQNWEKWLLISSSVLNILFVSWATGVLTLRWV